MSYSQIRQKQSPYSPLKEPDSRKSSNSRQRKEYGYLLKEQAYSRVTSKSKSYKHQIKPEEARAYGIQQAQNVYQQDYYNSTKGMQFPNNSEQTISLQGSKTYSMYQSPKKRSSPKKLEYTIKQTKLNLLNTSSKKLTNNQPYLLAEYNDQKISGFSTNSHNQSYHNKRDKSSNSYQSLNQSQQVQDKSTSLQYYNTNSNDFLNFKSNINSKIQKHVTTKQPIVRKRKVNESPSLKQYQSYNSNLLKADKKKSRRYNQATSSPVRQQYASESIVKVSAQRQFSPKKIHQNTMRVSAQKQLKKSYAAYMSNHTPLRNNSSSQKRNQQIISNHERDFFDYSKSDMKIAPVQSEQIIQKYNKNLNQVDLRVQRELIPVVQNQKDAVLKKEKSQPSTLMAAQLKDTKVLLNDKGKLFDSLISGNNSPISTPGKHDNSRNGAKKALEQPHQFTEKFRTQHQSRDILEKYRVLKKKTSSQDLSKDRSNIRSQRSKYSHDDNAQQPVKNQTQSHRPQLITKYSSKYETEKKISKQQMSVLAKSHLMFSLPKKFNQTSQSKLIPKIHKSCRQEEVSDEGLIQAPTPEVETEPCVSENESFILSSYMNENQKLRDELEKMKAIMKAREELGQIKVSMQVRDADKKVNSPEVGSKLKIVKKDSLDIPMSHKIPFKKSLKNDSQPDEKESIILELLQQVKKLNQQLEDQKHLSQNQQVQIQNQQPDPIETNQTKKEVPIQKALNLLDLKPKLVQAKTRNPDDDMFQFSSPEINDSIVTYVHNKTTDESIIKRSMPTQQTPPSQHSFEQEASNQSQKSQKHIPNQLTFAYNEKKIEDKPQALKAIQLNSPPPNDKKESRAREDPKQLYSLEPSRLPQSKNNQNELRKGQKSRNKVAQETPDFSPQMTIFDDRIYSNRKQEDKVNSELITIEDIDCQLSSPSNNNSRTDDEQSQIIRASSNEQGFESIEHPGSEEVVQQNSNDINIQVQPIEDHVFTTETDLIEEVKQQPVQQTNEVSPENPFRQETTQEEEKDSKQINHNLDNQLKSNQRQETFGHQQVQQWYQQAQDQFETNPVIIFKPSVQQQLQQLQNEPFQLDKFQSINKSIHSTSKKRSQSSEPISPMIQLGHSSPPETIFKVTQLAPLPREINEQNIGIQDEIQDQIEQGLMKSYKSSAIESAVQSVKSATVNEKSSKSIQTEEENTSFFNPVLNISSLTQYGHTDKDSKDNSFIQQIKPLVINLQNQDYNQIQPQSILKVNGNKSQSQNRSKVNSPFDQSINQRSSYSSPTKRSVVSTPYSKSSISVACKESYAHSPRSYACSHLSQQAKMRKKFGKILYSNTKSIYHTYHKRNKHSNNQAHDKNHHKHSPPSMMELDGSIGSKSNQMAADSKSQLIMSRNIRMSQLDESLCCDSEDDVVVKSEFFKELSLTQQEKFGDRFLEGYQRKQLITTCSNEYQLVYLSTKDDDPDQEYAIKQYANIKCDHDNLGGDNAAELSPECQRMVDVQMKMKEIKSCSGFQHAIEIKSDSCDMWLVFQVQPQQKKLISQLFSRETVLYKGTKVKIIEHLNFYKLLREDKSFQVMKQFIMEMCKSIQLLNEHNLVHGEINSNNIDFTLILDNSTPRNISYDKVSSIKKVRLKSTEQSYIFNDSFDHTLVKPQFYEFQPPEILENIDNGVQSALLENQKPWSHDIWSLGIVLLEISQGLPIDTVEKCRIQLLSNKTIMAKSILGVVAKYKPNNGELIISKIQVYLRELKKVLNNNFRMSMKKFYNYDLTKSSKFFDLIQSMLQIDPFKRISPQQVLQHPFCAN